MVYVNNGQVHQSPPWNFQRIIRLFDGIIMFFVLFFKSLVGIDNISSVEDRSGRSGTFRGSGRGGGGGGGGWGSGGGGGRPYGPGGGGGGGGAGGPRFKTMRDINPPTVGGCAGGSCGM
nr:glycine-rich selenoprotein-like [Leptinotarsa decemlineata]